MPNSATSTILVFAQVEKLSFSGLRAVSPAVFMAWNMGLSFSFSLIHSEMPSSRSENRKGIRQPQLSHCCWSTKAPDTRRSEEHTSELQSLMRISYAVFCLKKKKKQKKN